MTAARIPADLLRDALEAHHAKHLQGALGVAWHTAREYVYEGVPIRHRRNVIRLLDKVIGGLEAKHDKLVQVRNWLVDEEARSPAGVGRSDAAPAAAAGGDRPPSVAEAESVGRP